MPPHITLKDNEIPFFRSIITAKAVEFWNDSDIEIAASLARLKASVDELQRQAKDEPPVIENVQGNAVINPIHKLISEYTAKIVLLTRLLHVHCLATTGQSKDQGRANQEHRKSQKVKSKKQDPLIAPPVH